MSSESVFRAVAHPARRRILQLLRDRELTAGEIARQFKHSQPVTSQHLRVLQQAGLLSMRQMGVRRRYKLLPRQLKPLIDWVNSLGGAAD